MFPGINARSTTNQDCCSLSLQTCPKTISKWDLQRKYNLNQVCYGTWNVIVGLECHTTTMKPRNMFDNAQTKIIVVNWTNLTHKKLFLFAMNCGCGCMMIVFCDYHKSPPTECNGNHSTTKQDACHVRRMTMTQLTNNEHRTWHMTTWMQNREHYNNLHLNWPISRFVQQMPTTTCDN